MTESLAARATGMAKTVGTAVVRCGRSITLPA
jgi:hypothetical protein